MESGVVVLLVVLVVALVGGGVAGAVGLVRGVRGVRRALPGAADRVGLRARALVPGPAGQAARARREVATSLRRVRSALVVAGRSGAPVGDTATLLAQLDAAAATVDARLRVVETLGTQAPGGHQPGAGAPAPAIAAALDQARTLTTAADRLAEALLEVMAAASPDVTGLADRCATEAAALREAAQTMRAIT